MKGIKEDVLLEEIKGLWNFVEVLKEKEEEWKAEKAFEQLLKANQKPFDHRYISDYMGDDIDYLKIIIIDDKGKAYECPEDWSNRYACRHEVPTEGKGIGITEFIASLIAQGIKPKRFKVKRKVIQRDEVVEEWSKEGNITIEHLKIVKDWIVKNYFNNRTQHY